MGPGARYVLSWVTSADVSPAGFPFGAVRQIDVAGHMVRALRVTYVGELGWELHVPIAALGDVFDALVAKGDVTLAGYRAYRIASGLEKGYRAWGRHHTQRYAVSRGARLAVKLKSSTDFLGRAACEKVASAPLVKMLATLTTQREDIVLVGRETILRDGAFAGYLTSGGYGYTVAKPIGLGYIRYAAGVTKTM